MKKKRGNGKIACLGFPAYSKDEPTGSAAQRIFVPIRVGCGVTSVGGHCGSQEQYLERVRGKSGMSVGKV